MVIAMLFFAVASAVAVQSDVGPLIDTMNADVKACLSRTMPKISLTEEVSLHVFDDDGQVSEFRAKVYWKRFGVGLSKALVRFTEPPHKSGIALLVEESSDPSAEPEMTIYMSELRATRCLVGTALNGSMFGTGFSYEDFAQLRGVVREHEMRMLEETELDGRVHYVVETSPKVEHSAYARIVTYVDKQWCIPLVVEFYDRSDTLFKELLFTKSELRMVDGRQIPHVVTLHDHSRGVRTDVLVGDVEVDTDIRDLMFTRGDLSRGL